MYFAYLHYLDSLNLDLLTVLVVFPFHVHCTISKLLLKKTVGTPIGLGNPNFDNED
jgi:hypothetical protein